ncbi:uncharacterized protein E6C27_scaffold57G002860 [Cucumis melo var. makuwa]|uniref:Uncharacterized protein n=1 Tax=Cucumis melo var. makuwa TaxID=1194695 RepID=A0A5A7SV88_CUCMM|nr:uncharacterized protein E6C27_scaffold57G002860 [Cucumis melo var. makuwa]
MVNTQKGNYQAHSSKAVDEAPDSQTNMHGVFKSLISEMNSDEREDVPLAKLLKNGLFSNVEPL